MSEHEPNCASLRLLLTHPPQYQPCDCGAARNQVSSLIKRPGRPKVVAFPGCVAPVGDSENPGGAPPAQPPQDPAANMPAMLRALADRVEKGEDLPPWESLILIPCEAGFTGMPLLLGEDMSTTRMLGKMMLAQSLFMDWIKEGA